jgi:hypothetical protein
LSQLKPLATLTACLLLACGSGNTFELCKLHGTCPPPPPDSGMPTGCTGDSACSAPLGRCLVGEKRCVACLHDSDCAVGVCTLNTCALLPDACTTAQPLALGPMPLTVEGDTTRAGDDTQLACALPGSGGNDLVYTFTVDQPMHLQATATATTPSALQPVLGLRTRCDSLAATDNLACAYGGVSSASAELTTDVMPGQYWLWLDGEAGTSGAFTLEAQLTPTSTNASCADPTTLVFSTGRADVTGDTRGHTDDSSGLCGGAGSADVVYTFTLTQPQSARVTVMPSGLYAPVVYVRSADCIDTTLAAQLSCAKSGPGQSVDMLLPRLEAGAYYLFVDGASVTGDAAAGSFHLTVSLDTPVAAPANDDCQQPAALMFPSNGIGTATVHGDTSAANNDALGCEGSGPDVVYLLTLTQASKVGVRVTPSPGSALRPSAYLRAPGMCESEDPASELACAPAPAGGGPATLQIPSLPAGAYNLWVDGVDGTAGAFDLSVELAAAPAPPGNDACTGALTLSLASGPVTVNGTTISAGDDATLSCTLPFGGYSPDVVYMLDVPQTQAIAIDVEAAMGSQLKPIFALHAMGSCDGNILDEAVCVFPDPSLPARDVLVLPSVPAGQYALWIEGDEATQGDFTLRVTSGPPATAPSMNDQCSSSIVLPSLSSASSQTGDTRAANNDDEGGCGYDVGDNGELGDDVVYHLNITQMQTVTITVTPDQMTGALFRPLIYVRAPGQCATPAMAPPPMPIGCGLAPDYGQSAQVTLENLAPGTYNVWVDGAGLSSGAFSIRIQ